jgi:hypothetical protein
VAITTDDISDISDPINSVKASRLLVISVAQSPKEKNSPKHMCQVALSLSALIANPITPRATIAISAGRLHT